MKQHLLPMALCLLLLSPTLVNGHELWFAPSEDGLILHRGHRSSAADHGQPASPVPPEECCRATVIHADGTLLVIERGQEFPAMWPADSAALALTVSSGVWTKTPAGTVNRPRNETQTPLTSWLSLEGIKFIGAWLPVLDRPLGQDLEITPLANPLEMRKGQKLKILVTARNEPVAGVVVTYDGKPRGVTDPQGTINIRLKENGPQNISATMIRDEPTEGFDRIITTATLEFHLE